MRLGDRRPEIAMGRTASVVRWGAWPIVLACAMAHAGPPFVTDDPEPVELQRWEINTADTGRGACSKARAAACAEGVHRIVATPG